MSWLKIAADLPEYIYHVTTWDNIRDIQNDQLHPQPPDYGNYDNWSEQYSWPDGGTEDRIYFGGTEESIAPFAKDNAPVVIRMPTRALVEAGIPIGRELSDYFIREAVDPNMVEVKIGDNFIPLTEMQ